MATFRCPQQLLETAPLKSDLNSGLHRYRQVKLAVTSDSTGLYLFNPKLKVKKATRGREWRARGRDSGVNMLVSSL